MTTSRLTSIACLFILTGATSASPAADKTIQVFILAGQSNMEGQGVVAEGRLRDGIFQADEVLAKHDENYMPPEVADALKKSGQWKQMEKAMGEAGPPKGNTRK